MKKQLFTLTLLVAATTAVAGQGNEKKCAQYAKELAGLKTAASKATGADKKTYEAFIGAVEASAEKADCSFTRKPVAGKSEETTSKGWKLGVFGW